MQALDDAAVIHAMRAGDEWAWGEFVARARPVLEGYASRLRLPPTDHTACVDDLLTSVALYLANPSVPVPIRLAPYLVRAAARCRRQSTRNRLRREAWHVAAAHEDRGLGLPDGEGVVGSTLSAHARRAALAAAHDHGSSLDVEGASARAHPAVPETTADAVTALTPVGPSGPAERAVHQLVAAVTRELRPSDVQLLTWYADGVPHREIAAWLDVSYAAVAKRVQRLCQRLALRIPVLAADLPPEEQVALARLLRHPPHAVPRQATATTPSVP